MGELDSGGWTREQEVTGGKLGRQQLDRLLRWMEVALAHTDLSNTHLGYSQSHT